MEEENHGLHKQVSSFMSDVVSVSFTISSSLSHTSTGQTAGGGEGTLTAEDHGDRGRESWSSTAGQLT